MSQLLNMLLNNADMILDVSFTLTLIGLGYCLAEAIYLLVTPKYKYKKPNVQRLKARIKKAKNPERKIIMPTGRGNYKSKIIKKVVKEVVKEREQKEKLDKSKKSTKLRKSTNEVNLAKKKKF